MVNQYLYSSWLKTKTREIGLELFIMLRPDRLPRWTLRNYIFFWVLISFWLVSPVLALSLFLLPFLLFLLYLLAYVFFSFYNQHAFFVIIE